MVVHTLQSLEEGQERMAQQQQQHHGPLEALQRQQMQSTALIAAQEPAVAAAATAVCHGAAKGGAVAQAGGCPLFPMLPETQEMMGSSTADEPVMLPVGSRPHAEQQAYASVQLPFMVPETAAMTPSADMDWQDADHTNVSVYLPQASWRHVQSHHMPRHLQLRCHL